MAFNIFLYIYGRQTAIAYESVYSSDDVYAVSCLQGAGRHTDAIQYVSRRRYACKKANIQVNRKMLADLAVNDKEAFAVVVEAAKAAL